MNRRNFGKSVLALPALPGSFAVAQVVERRNTGLPPLKITDVKVISTSGGRRYRWTFVKIETSEPGLYGIGSASHHFQTHAVLAAIEQHLRPFLLGKNADQIENLWQSAHLRTYWRNGPVNNNAIAGMDMALWDTQG